ncbi:MAG: hypothetical protein HC831_15240 [Chloroflexia bacterium]|nr:hypothetical protein [Chloroflexia bacterium]
MHYIGLIYISFAHLTDGVFSKDEQTSIWKCLKKWMPEHSDHSEFSRVMDEIMQWYKQLQAQEDFEDNLIELAKRMNEYEWFTEEKKEESLKDLRSIALADKQFLDTEKKRMRGIAKLWNIEQKVVRRVVK